jgi:hypothetical protein
MCSAGREGGTEPSGFWVLGLQLELKLFHLILHTSSYCIVTAWILDSVRGCGGGGGGGAAAG